MEGLFTLLSLSFVMAISSFIVGSLPLVFPLSSSQLRLVSSIGMGILVGTSLAVIIPEGIETLYSVSLSSDRHQDIGNGVVPVSWHQQEAPAAAVPGIPDAKTLDTLNKPILRRLDLLDLPLDQDDRLAIYIMRDDRQRADPGSLQKREEGVPVERDARSDDEHERKSLPHVWVGLALISGFILMYLLDKVPELAAPKQQRPPHHISLDNLSSGLRRSPSPSRDGGLLNSGSSFRRSHGVATTTGLVIHAAADGIALGASSSDTGLSFIIFLAIMVHKAPASFGLTSVLLKQGLTNRAARAHLLVFSLAAPVGAMTTFLFVQAIRPGPSEDMAASNWRTGILLLFSAGTFLYVAMHTMQENAPGMTARDLPANGYGDPRDSQSRPAKSTIDLIASVIGMILPLFLQIGHVH